MSAYNPQPFPGGAPPQQSQRVHYPEADYPSGYPDRFYAPPGTQKVDPALRYSPNSGRSRADSGMAPSHPTAAMAPSTYKYPSPAQSPSTQHAPQLPRTPPSQGQQYFPQQQQQPFPQQRYQPPTPGFLPYSQAEAGLPPRQNLHPQDAHYDPDRYAPRPRRPRGQSEALPYMHPVRSHESTHARRAYSDDDESEYDERRRRHRRRRSDGYDPDRRRRHRERGSRKDSKTHDDDKRPTLADSTLWAIGKAKEVLIGR